MRKPIACCLGLLLASLTVQAEHPPIQRVARELGFAVAAPLAIIPTSANSPGRHGAFYKTRVVIHNVTEHSYNVQAILCGPGGRQDPKVIPMEPHGYKAWDNFLEAVFDYRGTGSVILVVGDDFESIFSDAFLTSAEVFSLTAEVYTDSPNGRFSTTVVNGMFPVGLPRNTAWNAGLSVTSKQRVNVGVFQLGPDSSIKARVYDSHGTLVETLRFEAEQFTWHQKTISAPVENGFIEWDLPEEGSYPWMVTVNNQSNDGTLVWATSLPPAE